MIPRYVRLGQGSNIILLPTRKVEGMRKIGLVSRTPALLLAAGCARGGDHLPHGTGGDAGAHKWPIQITAPQGGPVSPWTARLGARGRRSRNYQGNLGDGHDGATGNDTFSWRGNDRASGGEGEDGSTG